MKKGKIQSGIEEKTLMQSICATFSRRGTVIPQKTPPGLTLTYAKAPDRVKQWTAFRQRVSADYCPASLEQIVLDLACYIMPLFSRISSEKATP